MSESTLPDSKEQELHKGFVTTAIIYKGEGQNTKVLVIKRSSGKSEEPNKEALVSGLGASFDYPNSPQEAVRHEVGNSLIAKDQRKKGLWVDFDFQEKPIMLHDVKNNPQASKNYVFVGKVNEDQITRDYRFIDLDDDTEVNKLAFDHSEILKEFRELVRNNKIKLNL